MNIRTLTHEDVPFGLKLSRQNRWNQLEADWLRQIQLDPEGCFLAEADGDPLGTTCACSFGAVAWIALVLVDEERRGRGIGSALLQHTLDHLDRKGVASVRLDATPLGQPVYTKLGFRPDFTLIRFEGNFVNVAPTEGVRAVEKSDLAQILELDRLATGANRARLLLNLFDEDPTSFRITVEGDAFLAGRPGARAWHVGPCIGSAAGCLRLLDDLAARWAGRTVFLDVPIDQTEVVSWARAFGLTEQRRLTRMTRGVACEERPDLIACSFGPEKG